ncbi:MAG: hypothetical protein M1823_004998 [Watsoniomyces obsoletus]|nr:MAG: hypothetical protein M1823_004998 [Watsoniomyces obsoletus]
MSKRPAKPRPGGPKGGSNDEREETLQAVVLTDTFETAFNPFTCERPRCLLPVANTPLIEYTLEFLAHAGIQDVILYCGAHTELVESYLKRSKWLLSSSPFRKFEIFKSASRSVGDAMRDLDSRDIITGDFLIVNGDVVSNMSIGPAWQQHRARRAANKNAIMTMILREAGTTHRTKARRPGPVFVVDAAEHRCVQYEEVDVFDGGHYVNVDPDFLTPSSEIDIRSDLIDCRIDICTPDVLALWTDSFDYESPRKHFLHGVLKDHELNGKTVHVHILERDYAARVHDLPAYHAVSRDITSRWSYPICPDSNLSPGQSYRLQRGHVYMGDGVVLAQSCQIERKSIIGSKTSIGENSRIRGSVIGRRCQIGRNVTIEGAYLWDDVVIGDGSKIDGAIIADEAEVGAQCIVEPGALISFGVHVGRGMTVRGKSRISRVGKPHERSKLDGEAVNQEISTDVSVVGEDGVGGEFVDSDEDEDADGSLNQHSNRLMYTLSNEARSDSSISTLTSDTETEMEQPEHQEESSSVGGHLSTSERDGGVSTDDGFHHDAATSLFDALQRDEGPDIVQIELQGLRMGVDADYHQVRRAVISAFMKHIEQRLINSHSTSMSTGEAVNKVLKRYRNVFEKLIFDQQKKVKTDQFDFLLSLQRELMSRQRGENIMLFVVRDLYQLDVLDEEGLNQWWDDPASNATGELQRMRKCTEPFIEWLRKPEEDSEEEESEEEEEEGE